MNWERRNIVMNNAPKTIYAFCSAKGGTGKTTLAVACAKLLAADGRVPVLIDADVTGTSIADGLRLCAPKVTRRADGMIDLKAPPTGYFSRAQTLELRRARAVTSWTTVPPPPTYLNDALTHNCGDWEECNVASLLWKHEKEDGVLYVPSSALLRDVGIALGWLYYFGASLDGGGDYDLLDRVNARCMELCPERFHDPDLDEKQVVKDEGSCYDPNERRPANYYHDKKTCDCAECSAARRMPTPEPLYHEGQSVKLRNGEVVMIDDVFFTGQKWQYAYTVNFDHKWVNQEDIESLAG
jgi:hypothetical protein